MKLPWYYLGSLCHADVGHWPTSNLSWISMSCSCWPLIHLNIILDLCVMSLLATDSPQHYLGFRVLLLSANDTRPDTLIDACASQCNCQPIVWLVWPMVPVMNYSPVMIHQLMVHKTEEDPRSNPVSRPPAPLVDIAMNPVVSINYYLSFFDFSGCLLDTSRPFDLCSCWPFQHALT